MNMRTARYIGLAIVLGGTTWAQVTQRVSVAANGAQANDESTYVSISADGRFVAFSSRASNLAPGDGSSQDVFLRDRLNGTTEVISVDSNEAPGTSNSYYSSMTPDGRFVAFTSDAPNLVPGDTNGDWDVFVRDRTLGTTERVSYYPNGAQFTGPSARGSITADGRYVAFMYEHTGGGHLLGKYIWRIVVWDRQTGTGQYASIDIDGTNSGSDDDSMYPSISADGRYVAFDSKATNIMFDDTNGVGDIFVRDLVTNTTTCASLAAGGLLANGASDRPSISADGRYVAFTSAATNLVPGDRNARIDVFVRDLQTGAIERVSVDAGGAGGNDDSRYEWTVSSNGLSADGRFVAFSSLATNLDSPDTNGVFDVFVRDRLLGTTRRVSTGPGGGQGNGDSTGAAISTDGRYVAFSSDATNLVGDDTNARTDVFVHDLEGGPAFTSLCEPGVAGVLACPCGNPPSGAGRGCDNSAATGGAALSAAGGTYLSSDTLVFTTSGEKPTALSVLLQGDAVVPAGLVYGQGVRCVGGAFKRLYAKSASGGSITAPSFGAGDSPVSARSAALGSTIVAGQSRWYLVYYRDPIVLGGCASASTFNTTQTGRVTWQP